MSHPGLSYTEQECQQSLIQGKIRNQQNLNEGIDLCDSKLFGLHAFDNMAIIH